MLHWSLCKDKKEREARIAGLDRGWGRLMGRSRGCRCARLKVRLTLVSLCVHLPQSAAFLTQLECTAHHAHMHKKEALHEETHTHTGHDAGAPPEEL